MQKNSGCSVVSGNRLSVGMTRESALIPRVDFDCFNAVLHHIFSELFESF